MPIKGVKYLVKVYNSIIKTKLQITYINDSDNKLEATLEMPSNPDLVIGKMKIRIGEQEITSEVKEKEKAKEMYEDAVSRGH